MNHKLKTYSSYFQRVKRGEKPFEVRRHDRDFQVGDTLELIEIEDPPANVTYSAVPVVETGHRLTAVPISYILHGDQFGISKGWCVLGLNYHPSKEC